MEMNINTVLKEIKLSKGDEKMKEQLLKQGYELAKTFVAYYESLTPTMDAVKEMAQHNVKKIAFVSNEFVNQVATDTMRYTFNTEGGGYDKMVGNLLSEKKLHEMFWDLDKLQNSCKENEILEMLFSKFFDDKVVSRMIDTYVYNQHKKFGTNIVVAEEIRSLSSIGKIKYAISNLLGADFVISNVKWDKTYRERLKGFYSFLTLMYLLNNDGIKDGALSEEELIDKLKDYKEADCLWRFNIDLKTLHESGNLNLG